MNVKKYTFLKQNTFFILSFSFLLFVICFIDNQHSYSEISGNKTIETFIDTLVTKANQQYNEYNYNDAIEYYDKALALNPNATDVLYSKGLALLALQKYDEALMNFEKILEIEPNATDVLNVKNSLLHELKVFNNMKLKN